MDQLLPVPARTGLYHRLFENMTVRGFQTKRANTASVSFRSLRTFWVACPPQQHLRTSGVLAPDEVARRGSRLGRNAERAV